MTIVHLNRARLLGAFALCLAAGASLADDLPKPIRGELADFRASCRGAGTDIAEPEKAVRFEDLDGDGRPDAILDMDKARCTGEYTPYCGTGGCFLILMRALPGGHFRRIFAGQVWSFEILGEGKRKRMRFQLHGGYCGRAGPDGCTKEVRLTGRPFAFKDR